MAYKTFIPFARKEGKESSLDKDEDILFDLIENSSYQKRKAMYRHPLLWLAAQKRADDMAEKDYFAHISPSGVSPNQVVRSVGYVLPDWYPKDKNNVESISIGGGEPENVALAWLNSKKGHRLQVFGEDDFYREQECVGIGRSKARDGRIITVFLSAPCME